MPAPSWIREMFDFVAGSEPLTAIPLDRDMVNFVCAAAMNECVRSDAHDIFFFVPKYADQWAKAIETGSIKPSTIRGYTTLQSSLYDLIRQC